MYIEENDYLAHYGILRRSGRYPWGSSNNTLELETARSFLDYVAYLKNKWGLTESEIARDLDMNTTELRARKSVAKNEEKASRIAEAQRLKDKGMSNVAAAARMGIPESTYRALLNPSEKEKADILVTTTNMLRDQVNEKIYLDVGSGVENHLGISDTRLKTAIQVLKDEGYVVHYLKVPQLFGEGDTTVKVLTPPGISYSEVSKNRGDLRQITEFTNDNGRTWYGIHPPLPINPDRVSINYKETGGDTADGVIYVRPGVEDLSLGASSYAQVRVAVGDGHYLKGMAMYKNDLPDGVDIVFNTNKTDTGNKFDAMKPMETDPNNPFGAQIKRGGQLLKTLDDGSTVVTSVMNKVNEEGDWQGWSRTLSSQMLSKQDPRLAKQQLDMTFENREIEYNSIMALTNPTVRKKLLQEFADGTDAAAVHLKAAALPGQSSHVILPIQSIKENEIYAPNYTNGQEVVLIRYPHGGVFEIPSVRVNNSNQEAISLLGQARDAIGIHPKVAQQLSGADFDGDTVLVIPNTSTKANKIRHESPLKELQDFDPRTSFPGYPGMRRMSNTQTEMGKISNLITDMTIKGASHADLARAVKHSMVVIDAEKHGLNYKLSEQQHGIKQLREQYQPEGGASTLISRAKSRVYLPHRELRKASKGGPIDPDTGKLVYEPTGKTDYRTGKQVRQRHKALEVTDDARTLSSGTRIEEVYAEHSNSLKNLANKARQSLLETPRAEYSPSAAKAYKEEVDSLNTKLDLALRNRPLERQAQVIANVIVKAARQDNPSMDSDRLKKVKSQALEEARTRTGAKKQQIQVTQSEWDAIQAGAISDSKLSTILNNADIDIIRNFATPPRARMMTSNKLTRARQMMNQGYTRADIAQQLGVSVATLDAALYG